ncbi:MAG: hypothetical protein KJ944_07010 [Alphaproteobacteria bacterium]|nr:hypothetical protein [Alphaproteobacteria bacterium]MBU1560030.1 hypothetical protein [Alphaproteobacteria bacterium]MBU2302332.1 hypothetical protein [Alphaproteobacteria bacterium]MBU2369394.1 hypothetical protein [Alphaproteobacteria bacterium]
MPEFTRDPGDHVPFDVPVPEALARQPRRNERLDLSRQLQMDRELVVAHIFAAEDGGPVRTIINGRHRKPTGRHYMIKAGFRSSPWESMLGEYPFMQLCEVATPVHRFLAQPHRLEMQVVGNARRWVYFPDARIVVDRPFGEMLMEGVPFDQAVADWRPHMADGVTTVMLVEVKTDMDRRADESDYKAKLTLAREVYHRLGWGFVQVRQSDVAMEDIGYSVREIGLDNDASVDAEDVRVAAEYAAAPYADLGGLILSLGGRPVGMAKAAALHVRRVVHIGLDNRLRPDSRVRLVGDGKDLFGVMSR